MSKRYGNQHVTWFQTIGCCDWVSTTSCCEDRHTENSLDHVLFWQKIHQGLGGPVLPFQWRLSLANKSSVYPHIHQSFMFWFLQILQTFPSAKVKRRSHEVHDQVHQHDFVFLKPQIPRVSTTSPYVWLQWVSTPRRVAWRWAAMDESMWESLPTNQEMISWWYRLLKNMYVIGRKIRLDTD